MGIVRRRTPPSSPRGLALEIVQFSASMTLDRNLVEAVLQCTAGGGVTVTLPRDLPVGFFCYIEQGGAGQVTFAAATGATLVNRQSHTATAGQYGLVSVFVRSNPGGLSAEWALNGDTA
jgi:hypothetical protein